MAWEILQELDTWQRTHLPKSETGAGQEVLIWLLRTRRAPRPLKDLYRSSRYSEPTVRAVLRAFVDEKLVEFEVNDEDHRNRLPQVTPRFEALAAELQRRLAEASARLSASRAGSLVND